MANGTKTIKRSTRMHHATAATVSRHQRLTLPPSRWGPLPTEMLLRAIAIERTRGILKDHPIDPVAWQRKVRRADARRLRAQDKLWKQLRKRSTRTTKRRAAS